MRIVAATNLPSYLACEESGRWYRGLLAALAGPGCEHEVTAITAFDGVDSGGAGLCGGIELYAPRAERLISCFEATLERLRPEWTLISLHDPDLSLFETAARKTDAGLACLVQQVEFLPFGPASRAPDPERTRALRRADLIIAGSRFAAEYITRWANLPAVSAPLALFSSEAKPAPARSENGFVTIVNPSARRGIALFAALAAAMPATRFAAAPGWATSAGDLSTLTAVENIVIFGADSPPDVLAQTRVLLLPWLSPEAPAPVMVEAALRGIPVLAGNAGGLEEWVWTREPLLPPKVDAWRSKLELVLADRDYRLRQTEVARNGAQQFANGQSAVAIDSLLRSKFRPGSGGQPVNIAAAVRELSPEQISALTCRLRNKGTGPSAGAANEPIRPVRRAPSATGFSGLPAAAIIPLQGRGVGRPLFCVHALDGHVFAYTALARELGFEQPVYALQALGLTGERPPLRRVPDLARRYVEALRSVAGEGPYRIAGWSFGGLVGFEMAQQLVAAGQEVELLALLDTTLARREVGQSETREVRMAGFLREALGALGPAPLDQLDTLPAEEQLQAALAAARKLGKLQAWDDAHAVNILRVAEANAEARDEYRPRPYPDRLVFLRASASPPLEDGWRALAPAGVEVSIVPGDHRSMLTNPEHLRAVAAVLNQRLAVTTQLVDRAEMAS